MKIHILVKILMPVLIVSITCTYSWAGQNSSAGCALDLNYFTRNYTWEITDRDIESVISVKTNEEITVALVAQNAANLDTFQAEINFNPKLLKFVEGYEENKDAGVINFLKKQKGETFGFKAVQTSPGIINIAGALSGNNTQEAPDGSGIIALIKFIILDGNTNTYLTLFNVEYIDSSGLSKDPVETDRINILSNAEIIISNDILPPNVTISSDTPELILTPPIPVSIVFSEPVTGFSKSDIIVSNGEISDLKGNGAEYHCNIIPFEPGVIIINIPKNVVEDQNGNANMESNTFQRTYFVNHSPEIAGKPLLLVKVNDFYTFTPKTHDTDKRDNLKFTITNKPDWADFDLLSGTLSGMSEKQYAGITKDIVITVTDSFGASASLLPFSLTVVNDIHTDSVEAKDNNETDNSEGGGSSGCFLSVLYEMNSW